MFDSILFRSFLTFTASWHLFVNVVEYICETKYLWFRSDEAGFDWLGGLSVIKFRNDCRVFVIFVFSWSMHSFYFILNYCFFNCRHHTFNFLSQNVLTLVPGFSFLGWGIFLKIRSEYLIFQLVYLKAIIFNFVCVFIYFWDWIRLC